MPHAAMIPSNLFFIISSLILRILFKFEQATRLKVPHNHRRHDA
jgi:hypothetical protein